MEQNQYSQAKNRQKGLGDALRAELILLVFLLLFSALILFACRGGAESGTNGTGSPARFAEGTVVLGTDIGGMTRREAEAALRKRAERAAEDYRCRLSFGEKKFVLTRDQLDIESDLSSVLGAALSGGAGEYAVRFFPAAGEKLDAAVKKLSEEVNTAAKPARLVQLGEGEEMLSSSGERFAVAGAEAGVTLDEAGTKRLLRAGETEIVLPVFSVSPSAAEPKLPVLIASFSTSFASRGLCGASRVSNIKKAAALLNGTSLAPGERLSCNAVLGERTEEAGWLRATAFANGGRDTEQQFGGGICQVSSTLYNCALLAGLQVPGRCSHSRKVSYVEGGLDAALSWPDADLVILNSGAETVYVFMWTDESRMELFAEIWGGGLPSGCDSIRVESELAERLEPGEAEFISDPALSPGECVLVGGEAAGSRYRAFRIFYQNGVEIRREELAETVYPARAAIYAIGCEG